MGAGGSNAAALTDGDYDLEAAWSPDGTKIAFATDRAGNFEVYVMDADGSNPVNLTDHPAHDFSPAWSPDGTRLAFVTNRDGNLEVYIMDADGADPVNLTRHPAEDEHPTWVP